MMINFEDSKSIGGNIWVKTPINERQAEALAQSGNLPYIVAGILASRGIGSESLEAFINPKLQNLMPNPSCLKGMDVAAKRLAEAVTNNEAVGIIGDYDVDGATSSSVLRKFLSF